MNGLYIAAAVALVVIVLGYVAIREIRSLSKQVGEGDAREALSDEAFKAQTRRQKMARRARARGKRLLARMQAWGRTGSS